MAYTTINDPTQYFDTALHTGNNNNGRTFTGLNFQPDFIWGKVRNSGNYNHMFVDSSRGGDKFLAQTTAAEDPKSHGEITSWNSDGTTWINGTNATYPRVYYNDGSGSTLGGSTYVWWQWQANGGTTSSNTDGSITSTVQANTTAGFSIVTWTGNATASATVGHGLGVKPNMIMIKNRNDNESWWVGHSGLGGSTPFASGYYLFLNSTNAVATNNTSFCNAEPTTTTFKVGGSTSADNLINGSGDNMLAYCFAEIKGYSKFGGYTGNITSGTDGVFVYTGFKPSLIIVKCTSTTGQEWVVFDNKRDSYNVATKWLYPNATTAENGTADVRDVDLLSNGFKFRNAGGPTSYSGRTYIYMAFAESPFVSSDGVPTTAR